MSSLSDAQFEADFPPADAHINGRGCEESAASLMHRAQGGDRGAYGQMVVLYQHRLYNAIVRMVGDREDARELTQECFTRGLMKLSSFRGDASPYTWLFRIALNLSITRLRKAKKRRTFSLERTSGNGQPDDQASGLIDRLAERNTVAPDELLQQRERDEQVVAALGRLDAEYRAVLVMRDVEGFDYQQMAEVLDLPLGTLKSRLFRARLALRDELKDYLKL